VVQSVFQWDCMAGPLECEDDTVSQKPDDVCHLWAKGIRAPGVALAFVTSLSRKDGINDRFACLPSHSCMICFLASVDRCSREDNTRVKKT
jgi:hypothetical protein